MLVAYAYEPSKFSFPLTNFFHVITFPNILNLIDVKMMFLLVAVSLESMSSTLSSILRARRHHFKNPPAALAPSPVSQGIAMLIC